MDSVVCKKIIPSPLGPLTLLVSGDKLSGLYFDHHQPAPKDSNTWQPCLDSRLDPAIEWLRRYFSGEKIPPMPSLAFVQGTDFQRRVWSALGSIPIGETRTYSNIAQAIGSPSAVRAVGAAVGRNPLSLFFPCHRVVGKDGNLTGYAGGLDRKRWLLQHEGVLV